MKIIKFLIFALLGLVAIWVGLMLLGLVGTIVHLVFWLALLYIVGMIVWKLVGGGKKGEQERPKIEMKRQMDSLKEAAVKLEEIKREQKKVKQ